MNDIALRSSDVVPYESGQSRATFVRALPVRSPRDYGETLRVVEQAAMTLQLLQHNTELISERAMAVLARLREERLQAAADIDDVKAEWEHWQRRAMAAEIQLQDAEAHGHDMQLRWRDAEARAARALERADAAERRIQDYETFFSQVFDKLHHVVD